MLLRIFQLGRVRSLRWPLLASFALLALLILTWSIPSLVASRFIWPGVLARLTSDLDATVTAEPTTLQWFSPIELRNVRIENLAGEPVATIDIIRTESTLLSLLMSGGEVGTILIEQPELRLQLRADGSNLEDILDSYLSRERSSSATTGTIKLVNGTLTVAVPHNPSVPPARFDSIEATLQLAGHEGAENTLKLSSHVQGHDRQGALDAAVAWTSLPETTDWSVATRANSLDLSLLAPLLERLDVPVRLQGHGSLDAQVTHRGQADRSTIELRQMNLQELQLAAPDYLRQDVNLDELKLSGSCQVTGRTWQLSTLEMECDAGHLLADGEFAWPATTTDHFLRQLATMAQRADLQLSGSIDLAELAARLPQTLRIRPGTVVESGQVEFALRGGSEQAGRRWTAELKTSKLIARRDGQQVTWNAPLQITLQAHQSADAWYVDRAACDSSFLTLTGQGGPASGSFTVRCDLQQLRRQLQEFVDLGSLQATGTMSARLEWKENDGDRVMVHGTGLLENLDLGHGPGAAGHWREQKLSLAFVAEGEQQQRFSRVRTAQLDLESTTDQLSVQLLEPVDSPGLDAKWMIGCRLRGQSTTWFHRLQPLLRDHIPSHRWTAAGPIDMQLTMQLSRLGLELEKGTIAAEPFLFETPQIRVEEPAIAMELKGRWDFESGYVSVPEATFQSSALAFRVVDLRLEPQNIDIRATGDVTFRANLDELYRSWRMPAKQHDWKLGGSAEGQVSMVLSGDSTQVRWKIDLADLALDRRRVAMPSATVTPAANISAANISAANISAANISTANAASWVTVWREPMLKFSGTADCNLTAETMELERCELNSVDKLQLMIHGRLDDFVGPCRVDLEGKVTYDLAQLLVHWAPELKGQVQLVGHDTQSFRLRGPLFHAPQSSVDMWTHAQRDATTAGLIPPALYGSSGLSWQSADLFGIPVGAGAVSAKLEGGIVETGVIEMPISGGTLRIEPTVHLNQRPPIIALKPGKVLSNVQITPGMCDRWLKYVAPVVADATSAEGSFSASISQTTIPLRTPRALRAETTLDVQSATIGPGPLALQLIGVASQMKSLLQLRLGDLNRLNGTWVQLPAQQSRVSIHDERVHHDRLIFTVGDVVIHTRGSVGLDQSLSLVAEIPLRDEWIASNPRLGGLRGYVVRIPISGTLSDPRVDRRALERLAADALRKASGQILENELRNGLQQLFGSEP